MNAIQKLIQSDIKCLIEKSKGYNAIPHNATKGGLREVLLMDFFRKLIPSSLSISSGIICDAIGRTSNQTDFIIYDKNILPDIILDSNISVVPIETVYLTAEIKTTLTTKDLKKIIEARSNFNEFELAGYNFKIKIPSVILAFNTNISQKTLIDWMEINPDFISICIIDKFTISNTEEGIEIYEKNSEPNIAYWETLRFCLPLYNYLTQEKKQRLIAPLWDAYILGYEKYNELFKQKMLKLIQFNS